MGMMLSRFVIALSFFVVCTHLGGRSTRSEALQNISTSIAWKERKLHIQFVGQIRDEKGREYFAGPFGISFGSDGRLYVADDLAHRVLVFDKNR
jgi:hypothetical protein